MKPKKETIICSPSAWNVRETEFENTALDVRATIALPLSHIPSQRSGKDRRMASQAAGVNISIIDITPSLAQQSKWRRGSCLRFRTLYFPYSWGWSPVCFYPVLKYIDCKVFMHGTLNFHRHIYIFFFSPAKFKRRVGIKEPKSDHNKAAARFLDLLETYHRPRGGRALPKSFSRITTIGKVWRDHPIELGGRKQTSNSL